MVAPNGARRTKADHPNLPITIAELVSDAIACYQAGAQAIHAHVRDQSGHHTLELGLYRELIQEMAIAVPDMLVQLTTESAGKYSPSSQRKILTNLEADSVSVAIREFLADDELDSASRAYHQALEQGINVQHILYDRNDIDLL
ncbi:MAG: 3-keto-5-aminohexanoate cleavage protein, partial [Acidimicrobiaceae bacterium]|nr:3-keto-5-aminohexanoate cleavage protein [Acidimicrobiaceae bacterium]